MPSRSHCASRRAMCMRISSSAEAKRNTTNDELNWPGMKAMFHISAVPPGTRPRAGLRQRKIAHAEMYVPSHVSTSSRTMNGSGSLLMPSCVTADHQACMRSSRWSVRTYSERPEMIAMIWKKTSVAPAKSAMAWSSSSCQRTRDSR